MAPSDQKIKQLQMIEQSLQALLMQKQQFQLQQVEVQSALKELESVNEAYKIVGNIMVLTKKDDLLKELQQKKDVVELRIMTMEKQENQFRDKASKIQEEVMKELKDT